jgi:ABC-type transporter Mla subunit MlaD
MALMNELLEEAVVQCTAVAGQVNEGAQALATLIERADHLADALGDEADHATRLCHELASRLLDAEHGLDEAGHDAATHLQELGARVGEVQHRVGALLSAVHRDLGELETHRAQLAGMLDNQAQSAGHELEHLARHVAEVEAATEQHLQEAGQALHAFQEAVGATQTEIHQRANEVQHAMQELEISLGHESQEIVRTVHAVLVEQGTHLIEAGNQMLSEHNHAVTTVRKQFAEHAKEEIQEAAAPLLTAMETLRDLCSGHESALKDHSQQVLERVREAVQLMDAISPALKSAEPLG